MLILLAAVLPISLAALIVSSALQLYGIAYDIPQLVYGNELMERPAWILPGLAFAIAAGIATTAARRVIGEKSLPRSRKRSSLLLVRARGPVKSGCLRKARWRGASAVRPKVKNTGVDAQGADITYDIDVERLLDSLSRTERDLLRQHLAESRLAIRHDGVLVARKPGELMQKIEGFLLL